MPHHQMMPNLIHFDPFFSLASYPLGEHDNLCNPPNHHGPEPLVILGNDYARSLKHTNSGAREGQIGTYQTRMCTKTLG